VVDVTWMLCADLAVYARAMAERGMDDKSLLEQARKLLVDQAGAVKQLAEDLRDDGPQTKVFVAAAEAIAETARAGGTLLVTGLGKSGLIGSKIAATFASLSIPSHSIHPTEAAHGDLGNFRSKDMCLALSYSGRTDEVIALCTHLKQDGIEVIAISADNASPLAKIADYPLAIGYADASSPLPAPMCSTTATVALGDALALASAMKLQITVADFARRHPGGALGMLYRPVIEALRFVAGKTLHPVADDVTILEALRASEVDGRRPGAIVLVDRTSGALTGLFTDGDLRRLVLRAGGGRDGAAGALASPIRDVMTRNPSTLPANATIADAVVMVQTNRRDEVPVVDEMGRPVGLLDVQDLITLKLVKD
jgi:arabinose-5-phosphate isomerase